MRTAILLALVVLSATLSAGLTEEIGCICGQIKTLVPLVGLVAMMIGGVVYGAGQIMGAETRSRAVVWATALFMGGIIAIVLGVAAPWLIGIVIGIGSSAEGGGIWSGSVDYSWCDTSHCT